MTRISDNNALSQAVAQANSIIEMVAALNCDYGRLEELKDERDSLKWDVDNASSEHDKELAEAELAAWDSEYAEELAELDSEANGNDSEEEAREAIQNDPLSVEVRADWHSPTNDPVSPDEFMILLCTGGPAVRIVGELDRYLQPSRARIEYQDWFQPWQEAVNVIEQETLLEYCRQFWFGE